MKILHIVSGSKNSGSFKRAYLLHNYLLKFKISSKILNNSYYKTINDLNKVTKNYINLYKKILASNKHE